MIISRKLFKADAKSSEPSASFSQSFSERDLNPDTCISTNITKEFNVCFSGSLGISFFFIFYNTKFGIKSKRFWEIELLESAKLGKAFDAFWNCAIISCKIIH